MGYIESPRSWLLVLLTLAVSGCDADRAVPPVGDANNPDFKGCTFVTKKMCWDCGGCKQRVHPIVGCKAKNQCAQFCSECLPGGYTSCGQEPNCSDWLPPRGSLEDCQINSTGYYCCYFCAYPSIAFRFYYARGSDGKCLTFCDACIPAGYQFCEMKDGGAD